MCVAGTAIKKLAGVNQRDKVPSSARKGGDFQSLVQSSSKTKKQEVAVLEEEEPRDDFEGFGSITAMA